MPQKTTIKRSSPRIRSHSKRRAPGSTATRPRQRKPAPATSFGGDSLATIAFKGKSGTEVFFALGGLKDVEALSVYKDIYAAYCRLRILLGKTPMAFDPLEKGLSYPTALTWLLRQIRDILPKKIDFNIETEENGSGHSLTLFAECPWPNQWLAMEVGPALLKLFQENKSLWRLFLSFIRSFYVALHIDIWTMGMMGNSLEMMDDNSLQMEGGTDPEDIKSIKDEIASHRSGTPFRYSKLVRKAPLLKPSALSQRARRFKAGHPIANLIHQGAELMKAGCSLREFIYWPDTQEQDCGCFLPLLDQANIIWEIDSHLIKEHEQCLDCEAQEGIQQPFISATIHAKTKQFDLEGFLRRIDWPRQLVDYFNRSADLIEKFKKQ